MSVYNTFLRWWHQQRPRWLSRHYGERLTGLYAVFADAIAEAARQAARRRYPDADTPDADLNLSGRCRGLVRYPGENAANYVRRVNDHWNVWRLGATAEGMRDLFLAAGYDAELDITDYANADIVLWGLDSQSQVPVWGTAILGDVILGARSSITETAILSAIYRTHAPARVKLGVVRAPDTEDALPQTGANKLWRWQPSAAALSTGWEDDTSGDDVELTKSDLLQGSPTFDVDDPVFPIAGGAPSFTFGPMSSRYTMAGSLATADVGVAYYIGTIDRGDAFAPQDVVHWGDFSSTANGVFTRLVPEQAPDDGGDTNIRVVTSDGDTITSTVGGVLRPRKVHCIAIAQTSAGDLQLWINGVKQGEVTPADMPVLNDLRVSPGGSGIRQPFKLAEVGMWHGEPNDDIMIRLSRYARDNFGAEYDGPDPVTHPWSE